MVETIYPVIEGANQILREAALKGVESKYSGDLRQRALDQLENELKIIENQGSSAGYVAFNEVLHSVNATVDEFVVLGTVGSSLIAYVLGFSGIDPLTAEPRLYSEFFFGINGEKCNGAFEMRVTRGLYKRLMNHYERLVETGENNWKYHTEGEGAGVYYGRLDDSLKVDTLYPNFYISFFKVDDTETLGERIIDNDILTVCKPESFSDYVKCFGLSHGTDVWLDNAKDLLKSGTIDLAEVIADREDVYETLLNHGVEKEMAYNIAEFVRKGKVSRKGWAPEMLEAMSAANVPEWFIKSCEKIKYLFPRAHSLMFCKWIGYYRNKD